MNIQICAVGSHGDVLPFIALGREFRRRGHAPRVFANAAFEHLAKEADLEFTATGSSSDMSAHLGNPDSTDPMRGMALLAKAMMRSVEQSYPLLCREFDPGNTVVVASSLAWSARLLSETHQAPCTVVHLAPSWFRSEHVAPSIGPLGHLARAPRFVKRWAFKAMDRRFLDPLFTIPFNRVRVGLGLAPVEHTFDAWLHQTDLVLGLFPDWFAPRQPDWPKQLELHGFPLYDHGQEAPLSSEVTAFMAAGAAPILFTAGTANASSHAFFSASAEACRISGHRAILLAQDVRQVPETMSEEVAHFSYIPFQALLPQVAAIVHHGGIGTTSQALLAGIPQLIRPMGFDQFDNALRAVKLGVAKQLMPRRYGPQSAARALIALTSDDQIRERCAVVARQTAASRGVQGCCDAILRLRPRMV
ncbi:nucleotide disphospho-sugar-binding domain-containing protein [Polaromonas sp.]|uniref:glycosyltransferase n=1 Tax=Polaromonas sp. TaxID=1869339 RepID=UPI0032657D5D